MGVQGRVSYRIFMNRRSKVRVEDEKAMTTDHHAWFKDKCYLM